MDAWNAAQLILDISFGVAVILALVSFIYFRERRLRRLVADYVTAQSTEVQTEQVEAPGADLARLSPASAPTPFVATAGTTTPGTPPLLTRYHRGEQVSEAGGRKPISGSMSRTEKYLEAVRMYRDGRRREDIESSLGISFMELELLGQLK